MNKFVKGAVAGAAGLVLLLGGAGTLAYWNAETTVNGGSIVAGNLTLTNSGSAVWTDGTGAAVDLSTFRVVPGDTLNLTQTVTLTATGNNLVGTLSLAGGGITGDLAGFLTQNATMTIVTPTQAGVSCTGATCTITAGSAGVTNQNITVKVAISFPKSTTAGFENAAMLKTASLAGLTIRLEQTH
jgi:alternate signal-mediated exported protein